MILHIRGSISGFSYSHGRRKQMILHICEPTSALRNSHVRRRKINDIVHLWARKWFLFIHIDEEK
jgi:hypothetical protein